MCVAFAFDLLGTWHGIFEPMRLLEEAPCIEQISRTCWKCSDALPSIPETHHRKIVLKHNYRVHGSAFLLILHCIFLQVPF